MQKVLIAGGSGLIGRRLFTLLQNSGYYPIILTRRTNPDLQFEQMEWNIQEQLIDPSFADVDHIINLAGAGIADKRWSQSRKLEIVNSRIQTLKFLKEAIQKYEPSIQSFVSASAVGYYGNSGSQLMDETSSNGTDFLAEVCNAWENEASTLSELVERLSILRIGVVLASDGGALQKMAQPVSLGVASYPGKGDQYLPWIHLDDICNMTIELVKRDDLSGIFNGVSPNPVQQKEFTYHLKQSLNRFAIHTSAPVFALKMAMGEMSAVILNSNNVSAQKIVDAGFEFMYPRIEEAIAAIYS